MQFQPPSQGSGCSACFCHYLQLTRKKRTLIWTATRLNLFLSWKHFTVPTVSYYSLHGGGNKQCVCLWISILSRVVVIDTSKEDKKHRQSRLELRNMLSLQCFRRNALSIFTVHNGIHEDAVPEPLGITVFMKFTQEDSLLWLKSLPVQHQSVPVQCRAPPWSACRVLCGWLKPKSVRVPHGADPMTLVWGRAWLCLFLKESWWTPELSWIFLKNI